MGVYPVYCKRCHEHIAWTPEPGVTGLCPGCARRMQSQNHAGCFSAAVLMPIIVFLLRLLFRLWS